MLQDQGFIDVGGGMRVKDGAKLSTEISDRCERCHGLGKVLFDGAFLSILLTEKNCVVAASMLPQ